MDQKQFHILILHCFLMGKHSVQAKQWLEKYFKDSASSETTIKRWFADFKRGRRDTDDAERSGRPKLVRPENKKNSQNRFERSRSKFRELDNIAKLLKERVGVILHEYLTSDHKKIC
ncbi:hypothetical protein GWI33_008372 [Rhynchophorus ferrugineus]|uniref:Mos1 transposase HTH domain-containing protein n=1 Tax=Rhynchophorus ferrugineus TaxID=354439 RepID=A0A834IIH3_RHYFE|nr:hypothetical protein GWI33_008372 [Rhynchophorus ferrugineus]